MKNKKEVEKKVELERHEAGKFFIKKTETDNNGVGDRMHGVLANAKKDFMIEIDKELCKAPQSYLADYKYKSQVRSVLNPELFSELQIMKRVKEEKLIENDILARRSRSVPLTRSNIDTKGQSFINEHTAVESDILGSFVVPTDQSPKTLKDKHSSEYQREKGGPISTSEMFLYAIQKRQKSIQSPEKKMDPSQKTPERSQENSHNKDVVSNTRDRNNPSLNVKQSVTSLSKIKPITASNDKAPSNLMNQSLTNNSSDKRKRELQPHWRTLKKIQNEIKEEEFNQLSIDKPGSQSRIGSKSYISKSKNKLPGISSKNFDKTAGFSKIINQIEDPNSKQAVKRSRTDSSMSSKIEEGDQSKASLVPKPIFRIIGPELSYLNKNSYMDIITPMNKERKPSAAYSNK